MLSSLQRLIGSDHMHPRLQWPLKSTWLQVHMACGMQDVYSPNACKKGAKQDTSRTKFGLRQTQIIKLHASEERAISWQIFIQLPLNRLFDSQHLHHLLAYCA